MPAMQDEGEMMETLKASLTANQKIDYEVLLITLVCRSVAGVSGACCVHYAAFADDSYALASMVYAVVAALFWTLAPSSRMANRPQAKDAEPNADYKGEEFF